MQRGDLFQELSELHTVLYLMHWVLAEDCQNE